MRMRRLVMLTMTSLLLVTSYSVFVVYWLDLQRCYCMTGEGT